MKQSILYTIALAFTTIAANAQFVVDGSDVTIQAGAEVYIDEDFINQSTGLTDNQGTLTVTGDWLNNGSTNAISMNQGLVELAGGSQLIGGSNSTTFHHLVIATAGTKSIDRFTSVGSSGLLQLNDGVLFLDGNTLEIQNSSDTAISRILGVVASETSPMQGALRWNIMNSNGTYQFPMGTMSGVFIPVEVDVTTSGLGMPSNGFITVSTYPTNDSNRLLPSGISNMDLNGTDVSLTTVDRFWDVTAGGYMMRPTSNISLTYNKANDFKPNNNIIEDSLVFLSWNPNWTQNTSTVNKMDSTVILNGVSTYRNYTLQSKNTMTTGLNDFNTKFTYEKTLYPNPSTGSVQMSLISVVNENMSIQFYNATGQLIFEQNEQLQVGSNQIDFDLNALPNGIYHVIFSAENVRDHSKLILSK